MIVTIILIDLCKAACTLSSSSSLSNDFSFLLYSKFTRCYYCRQDDKLNYAFQPNRVWTESQPLVSFPNIKDKTVTLGSLVRKSALWFIENIGSMLSASGQFQFQCKCCSMYSIRGNAHFSKIAYSRSHLLILYSWMEWTLMASMWEAVSNFSCREYSIRSHKRI